MRGSAGCYLASLWKLLRINALCLLPACIVCLGESSRDYRLGHVKGYMRCNDLRIEMDILYIWICIIHSIQATSFEAISLRTL